MLSLGALAGPAARLAGSARNGSVVLNEFRSLPEDLFTNTSRYRYVVPLARRRMSASFDLPIVASNVTGRTELAFGDLGVRWSWIPWIRSSRGVVVGVDTTWSTETRHLAGNGDLVSGLASSGRDVDHRRTAAHRGLRERRHERPGRRQMGARALRRRGNRGREAPAYVLTNGHCPEFPGANDVFVDRPAPSNHRVIFNYFADTPGRQLSVPVSRIAYATMKGRTSRCWSSPHGMTRSFDRGSSRGR
jgi:hypothetical protein